MLYYLDSRSEPIQEWLSENGEYIGIIGGADGNTITAKDISVEKIEEHKKERKFLVCAALVGTWWVAVLFNTPEGAAEVKAKYKGKPLLWYWIDKDKLEFCMHHMQLKYFKKEFPDGIDEQGKDIS